MRKRDTWTLAFVGCWVLLYLLGRFSLPDAVHMFVTPVVLGLMVVSLMMFFRHKRS